MNIWSFPHFSINKFGVSHFYNYLFRICITIETMKKLIVSLYAIIFALSFMACGQKEQKMNSYVSIFEIPATDISRAINFYQSILGVKIEQMEFPGMQMGLLPYEGQQVVGLITKGEGYEPSPAGVTVFLNGGDNLQNVLDKITKNGGKVQVPKTPHADENGFFAIFLDSEGNKLGLHSPN